MIYLTLQQVIEDHDDIIETYGGVFGIRDLGLLSSALDMPKATMYGEDLHPSIFDKAAAYLFHIIRNHPFLDGNKRTATAMTLTFLLLNKIHIKFNNKTSKEFEELVVDTAKGKSSKNEVALFLKGCHQNKKSNNLSKQTR